MDRATESAREFAAMVAGPPPALRLDRACSLMTEAFTGRPCADMVETILGSLADRVDEPSFENVLAVLARQCTGNRTDYYDPRNSFIDDVLRRGVGIPIALSVIAIEIGRRRGVEMAGVGLPGHVVVRDGRREIYGDPFNDGRVVDRAGLVSSWRALVGGDVPFDELYLAPMSERMILIRMLTNLRGIYLRRDDPRALLSLSIMRGAFAELAEEAHDHARWVRTWN